MTSSQGGSKSQQVNNHIKSECLGNVNGFVSSEPVSQGDNELRNSKGDENPQNGCNQVAVEGNTAPQPPPQSLVHWERFLHVRSIKVMLVENDDCTRYIVTAFLRNCNYEVIEAANGFQAWKILENLSNHIDIVLTEVVMPCLSGVSLLCKIMSHKTRKNIPVIMMSSHDSMGLVFKCLSKGAVDFLVKPIRKNEIKNLWQHVWRRCHSSSGSGSESGVQPQKSVNSKNNLRYDNNGSKDRDDNGSTSGSGTESSWRKHAHESPEAASPSNHDHLDSACAIVIRPVQTQEQPYTDNDGKFKERSKNSEMHIENGKAEKIMNANTNGVKRAWESNNDGKQVQNGCNILRHSEVSAFTRYKSTSNPVKGTPGITATCSQPDKRSSSEQVTPRKADVAHEELRVHHIHHHHHVHHYHNIDPDPPLLSNPDDLGSNNLACGSSNIVGRPGPANLENYSLNRSGSGSKHGSNLQNGSNPAVNIEVTKVENDEKSEIGCLNRLDQRKAALTKFRQKRELRCFQKKVRYQNRKRLAEQRPRVRGQFVKGNSSTNATDG